MTSPKRKIYTFLAITLALSTVFYILILSAGTLEAGGGLLVLGLMWSPGAAALVTQLVFERSLRGLGWRLGRFKYLLIAYLLPLAYCLVVYGITWLSGLGGFPAPEMMAQFQARLPFLTPFPGVQIPLAILLGGLLYLPSGLLSGLGEEIGWRGLFVPELSKVTSFTGVSLISGVVWALWHFPLLFFADYNLPGAPRWYAGLMFFILVVGISFPFAWLSLRSRSLWPAAVLHASHNLFVQAIFTPLTVQNEVTPYIIDEFGVGLAFAGVVVALVFWSRRRDLAAAPAVRSI